MRKAPKKTLIILSMLLIISIIALASNKIFNSYASAEEAEANTNGNKGTQLIYSFVGNNGYADNVEIKEIRSGDSTSITIPDTLTTSDGRKFTVRSIGNGSSKALGDRAWTKLVISKNIQTINANAFKDYTTIDRVSFKGGSLCSTIGDNAFSGCTSLEMIRDANADFTCDAETPCTPVAVDNGANHADSCTNKGAGITDHRYKLPASIQTIGANAFNGCSALKALNLNTGVTTVGAGAFTGALETLTINSNIQNHNNAFKGHTGITRINIGKYCTIIYNNMFEGCTNLGLVKFNSGSTCSIIKANAFAGCTKLSNIKDNSTNNRLPKSVTTIDDYAFYNCTALTELNLNTGVTTLGENTFKGTTPLTTLTINSDIANHNNAFKGHTGITTLKFGSSCTSIYDSMFEGCTGITTVRQTNNIKLIGARAFLGCSSLGGHGRRVNEKEHRTHHITYSTNKELEVGKDAYRFGGYAPGAEADKPTINITQSVEKANNDTYYADGIGKVTMNISATDEAKRNAKDYIVCLDTTGSMANKTKVLDEKGNKRSKMQIAVEALKLLATRIYEENPENRLAIVTQKGDSYLFMDFIDGTGNITVDIKDKDGNTTTKTMTMAEYIVDILIGNMSCNSKGNKTYGNKGIYYESYIPYEGANLGTNYKTGLFTMADIIAERTEGRNRNVYGIFISDGEANRDTGKTQGAGAQIKGFCDAVWSVSVAITSDQGDPKDPSDEGEEKEEEEEGPIEEIPSNNDKARYLRYINTIWGDKELYFDFPDAGELETNFKAFMNSIVDVSTSSLKDITFKSRLNTDMWEFYTADGCSNAEGLSTSGTDATVTIDRIGKEGKTYSYYIKLKDDKRDVSNDDILVSNYLSASYMITGGIANGQTETTEYTERLKLDWIASHILTIDPNNGTIDGKSDKQTKKLAYQAVESLPTPIRNGYKFKEWKLITQNSGGVLDNTNNQFTMGDKDAEIQAQWTANSIIVKITKTDSITGEKLNGATFGLYEWNGRDYTRKETIKEAEGEEGYYVSSRVYYTDTNLGKYRVVEEQSPTYYTNSNYYKDLLIGNESQKTEIINLTNEPNKVRVAATKIDSESKNKLEGVTFTIYEWDTTINNYKEYSRYDDRNEQDETMHFQQDRTYLSEWLYANKDNEGKFRIIETGTPEGYYGDFSNGAKKCNDITITGGNNGDTINLSNSTDGYENIRVKGTINITKIDRETNKTLAQGDGTLDGAVYGLFAAEDIYHKDKVTGRLYEANRLVRDARTVNGKITFEGIEIGRYYIKEITAPKGYLLNEEKYYVNMDYEGETVPHLTKNVTVNEQVKKQAFILQKISSNSGSTEREPLEGAGFKIFLIKDLAGVKNGTIKPGSGGKYNPSSFIGYDFTNEQTALDYRTNSEGVRIPEAFTNKQGQIVSPELAYGQYVVIESTVPPNVAPIIPFIVTIEEDSRTPQNQRIVDDVEFEALAKVIKKDSLTHKNVLNKNAKYRIWSVTENKYIEHTIAYPTVQVFGTEENPYQTNEKGEFLTPMKLQIGEYELREISAPEGYILTGHEGKIQEGEYTETPSSVVNFSISTNRVYYEDPDAKQIVINVEQYNDQMLGELKMTKTGEKLSGTTTREDGTVEPLYEEVGIQGAEFEIYAREDIWSQDNQGTKLCGKDELVKKITTNEQGITYLDNLPIGQYYIKEVKAGEGFTINNEIKEFDITYQGDKTSTQVVEVSYKNERQKIDLNGKGGLEVEKIADKTVYKPGEEITYTVKISNTTQYNMKNIKIEEKMIEGKFEDIQEENITKTGDKTVEIKELKSGETIQLKFIVAVDEISKLDNDTEKILVKNKIIATGKVIKPIPTPPPGYPPEVEEDIEGEGEEEVIISKKDLIIVKEAVKEEYQPGETAQYIIKVINNGNQDITKILVEEHMLNGRFIYLEESNKYGVEIANEGQKVAINRIEPGETVILRYEYTITQDTKVEMDENKNMILGNKVTAKGKIETPDPDDPENPDKIITKEVEDEDTEEIQIKPQDSKHLGIIKKDLETGENLQGATIGLYTAEDIIGNDGNVVIPQNTLLEKATTNSQGKAQFTIDLPLGRYYIKEIEAPKGYKLSEEIILIDATYKGQDIEQISVSKVLPNRATGIKIAKKDVKGNYLNGAKLEIVTESGNVIDTWETGDGIHTFRKLEIGKTYILREVEPANGYVTAEQLSFKIDEQEKLYYYQEKIDPGLALKEYKQTEHVEMIDEKTKVKIEIIDKETGEPIPGMIVEIIDKETGEKIYEYETDENPKIIEGIPIGDYEIISKDPDNRGYVTEKKDLKVEDTEEEQQAKIEQDYTKIEISLRDQDTKEKIKGKFEIIDKDGKIIQTIEILEGTSKLERIPPGEYTIHQIEAQPEYFLAEDIKIKIADTAEVQEFEVLNKKKIVNFSIDKTLASITCDGQNIEIADNKLAKMEIKTSAVKKTELIARYNIQVKNEGEVAGTVKVLEIIPQGYEVVETPEYWTPKADGTLETEVKLEVGESKILNVNLRWINSETNLGSQTNTARLESIDGNIDIESKDDTSSATIVISIKTGEKVSVIIIGMLLISFIICGYMMYRLKGRMGKGPSIRRIKFLMK